MLLSQLWTKFNTLLVNNATCVDIHIACMAIMHVPLAFHSDYSMRVPRMEHDKLREMCVQTKL